MDHPTFQVQVKYAVEFVKQLLPQGDEATRLVLAGDLSRFRDGKLAGVCRESIPVADDLYRASYGRVYIPLSGRNKYELKQDVLPFVGLRTLVEEVMLERYGRLLCHAPNFFQDAAHLSDSFSLEFVEELAQHGIIQVHHARPQSRIASPASHKLASPYASQNYAVRSTYYVH